MLCAQLRTSLVGTLANQANRSSYVHSTEALEISATSFQALFLVVMPLYTFQADVSNSKWE